MSYLSVSGDQIKYFKVKLNGLHSFSEFDNANCLSSKKIR